MDVDRNQVVERVKKSRNDIVALASKMIELPSPTGEEGPMAEWLMAWLGANGFEVTAHDIDPEMMENKYKDAFFRWHFPYENRPNVLGRYKGRGGGKSLMINFHMDVVAAEPDLWETDPWKAVARDGMLTGRGAADMKGGAAAALFAVKSILDAGVELKGDILIAGVIEEEGPGNGTLALQAAGVQADACIIPEPTDLTLAVGVTGGVYGFVEIKGKAAHSTTPWNGVNAVEKAFCVQKGIQAWQSERRGLPVDPLFSGDPETAAAGSIISIDRTDDRAVGKIPASANVMIRATVLPGETPEAVTRGIEAAILDQASKDEWLSCHPPQFSWIKIGARNHSARLSNTHSLCTGLSRSYESVTGNQAGLSGLVSPADMQQLMNYKPQTPCLMFGPGSIYQAHTENESVPIAQLVEASAVMADFIMNWCNEG